MPSLLRQPLCDGVKCSPHFFEHYRELSEADQATIRDKRDRYQAHVQALVERGIATGMFRETEPRLTTLAVFGMCNWAYQWFNRDGELRAREIHYSNRRLFLFRCRSRYLFP